MVDNGQKVVLAQGAPPQELVADHETIPVNTTSGAMKRKKI